MPKTRLISPGSIPNHKLLKNLQLQDNYISNDGGDEGIRIDDAGKVGIGTDDPDNTLDIQGSTTNERIRIEESSGVESVLGAYNGTYGFVGTDSNHPFIFHPV